eukprot:CAMPEP_0117751918 /NCGR_PEP_ID=MMETSP0947-20121206/11272_1 /TAXON_ID=44440 /ORGANISM="Chattonella subsalsa, Strain CCMP2191" /LENGTH=504 /DNA_ID=CAMNT_0005570413 /DNA_START=56 /DNA_END=1570 /DNA_ORIENTATION=-
MAEDDQLKDIFGEDSDSDDSDPDDSFMKSSSTNKEGGGLDNLFTSSDEDSDAEAEPANGRSRLQKGKKTDAAKSKAKPKAKDKESNVKKKVPKKKKKKKLTPEEKADKRRRKERQKRLKALKRKERSDDMIPKKKKKIGEEEGDAAAGSGDEYDSGDEVKKTKADEMFIDSDDENAELLDEYEKENQQKFKDVRPDASSDEDTSDSDNDDDEVVDDDAKDVLDSTLRSMKRPRKKEVSTKEKEELAQEFLYQMDKAYEDDRNLIGQGQPATRKLKMLKLMVSTLGKKTIQSTLLDFDLLGVVKKWIEIPASGELCNLTLRQQLLKALLPLPVNPEHLKRSKLGMVIMTLYKHPDELKENKRLCKELIEKWSRPLFHKETDMRQLGRVHEDRIIDARQRVAAREPKQTGPTGTRSRGPVDILDRKGREANQEMVRARCPYSMGFNFVARPEPRFDNQVAQQFQQNRVNPESKKGRLNKLMVEGGRRNKAGRAINVHIAAPKHNDT